MTPPLSSSSISLNPSLNKLELSQKIKELALELGFSDCKITRALHKKQSEEFYYNWLKNENHGSMDYLVRHAPMKANPKEILPSAKSIILVTLNYYQSRTNPLNQGQVSRYAYGRDYHKIFKSKLKKLHHQLQNAFPTLETKIFSDAGPLHEKTYATEANLGYIGKNTLLITPKYGSWVLLGEILIDQPLEYDTFNPKEHGICGTCNLCHSVCPTGALKGDYTIDASLCISYLTIEHKGIIPEKLRPLIGDWIFGCDLCQEVCPHNFRQKETTEEDFKRAIAGSTLDLKEILSIKTDEEFLQKFAGSPLMRAKRIGLQRNASIVAGNLKRADLLPELTELSQSQNPILSEHASWAIQQINYKTTNYTQTMSKT